MTADRDTARVVRSWLRTDEHESADRVLGIVLSRLDTTPQRRPLWPTRRSDRMNTYAKLIAAAAAVLVVAVVGSQFLPGRGGVGGPATPAPTASATASPAPAVPALPSNDSAALPAGSYVTGDPFPFRVTATVPAGWHGHVPGPYYADFWLEPASLPGGIYLQLADKVFVDPCDRNKGFTDAGSTVDDLVAALRHELRIQVANVSSASIDGYSGTQLVVTAPASLSGCAMSSEGFVIWQNPLGGESPALAAGESIRIWVLDVAGKRLVIAFQEAEYNAAQRAAAQSVFDSLRIAPAR